MIPMILLLCSCTSLVSSQVFIEGKEIDLTDPDVNLSELLSSPVEPSHLNISEHVDQILAKMNLRFLGYIKHLDNSHLSSSKQAMINSLEIMGYDDRRRSVTLLGFFNNSDHEFFQASDAVEDKRTEIFNLFQQIHNSYLQEREKTKDAEELSQELLNLTMTYEGRDLLWHRIFNTENIDQDIEFHDEMVKGRLDHVDENHFDYMKNNEEYEEEATYSVGDNETVEVEVTANAKFWGRDCFNDTMCTETIAWCDTEVDQCRPVWWFWLLVALAVLWVVAAVVICILKGFLDCLCCSTCCKA